MKRKRKRKQQTPLQKEAKKQIRRLKQSIKRYEKQGFDVTFEIPTQQKITKKYVETLKGISYIDILKQSFKVNIDTGEVKSGWGLRVNPPKDREKYESYTQQDFEETDYAESIVQNFYSYLSNYPDVIYRELKGFISQKVLEYGVVKVAESLLVNNESKLEYYLKIYDSLQGVIVFENDILNDLKNQFGMTPTQKDNFEKVFDESQ